MFILKTVPVLAAFVAAINAHVSGELSFYTPSWEDWDHHVIRWSGYDAPTFSMVFKPETAEELSQGLTYLSSNKIAYLATKSGGHGNTRSLAAYQDVTQINLDNFRNVTINADNTVTVGGGAKFIDLIPKLYNAGRELTVGSFPCVGVHGVMLGGGMGRLMGKYGLMSDALQRVKIALWNGTVVEASDDVNQDLFWGVRGVGHNLGVVIESTLETWPDLGGMHYNADMVFTDDSLEGVLNTAKKVIEGGLDPEVGLILGYVFDTRSMNPLLILNLVYAHGEDAGRHLASSFASTPVNATYPITRVFFNESLQTFEELGSGAAVPGVCDDGLGQDLYTASSPTFFDVSAMKDLYKSYGDFVRANPVANRSLLLFETTSRNAINAFPYDFSAYPHRGKLGTNAIIQMTWDDETLSDAADNWGKNARNLLIKPEVSGYDRLYIYQNYANNDEPISAKYGYEKWRHEKLTTLKQKYDPHGFFNAYNPIPLKMSGWDQDSLDTSSSAQVPLKKDEL